MNERTLKRPLDGSEIVEIITQKVRYALQHDCTLAKHLSYPAFNFKAFIAIEYQTTGRLKSTAVRTEDVILPPSDDPELPVQNETVEVTGTEQPPNEARIEAGLPVPAVTMDQASGKPVERKISYKDPRYLKDRA